MPEARGVALDGFKRSGDPEQPRDLIVELPHRLRQRR
jgi:hypothetical protein